MIPVIIYFLPTLLAAWLGWKWKRWKGVFLFVMGLWLAIIAAGVLFFSCSYPSLKEIVETVPT